MFAAGCAAFLLPVPACRAEPAVDVHGVSAHFADVFQQFHKTGIDCHKVLSILALKFGKPEMLSQPDIAVNTHVIYLYHEFTPFLVSECSDYY